MEVQGCCFSKIKRQRVKDRESSVFFLNPVPSSSLFNTRTQSHGHLWGGELMQGLASHVPDALTVAVGQKTTSRDSFTYHVTGSALVQNFILLKNVFVTIEIF